MRTRHLLLGAVLAAMLAGTARAESELLVPLLTFRTGPFAATGAPIADGMRDYLEMLNQRDGGIGGARIRIEECETGYDAQRGVACYESTKRQGALVYNPGSTGLAMQLIPRAAVDRVPILTMGYGLSAAAVGSWFPWIFNPPATYWDGVSAIIEYLGALEGGLERLGGKKIGYIFLNSSYGREPLPLLYQLASRYGFQLPAYAVEPSKMQDQSQLWLNVRRDRPDYLILWGWGVMNSTAIEEAVRIRYPMDRFIGAWWSGGEDELRPAGDAAKGFKTLNLNGVGTGFPVIRDIRTYVVDKGLSRVEGSGRVGESLYNRGVMNAVLIAEAIRHAQWLTGKQEVSAEDMRRGLETLDLDAARLKELGLAGFMAPLKLTCTDHSGAGELYVQAWDGTTWRQDSEWFPPLTKIVRPALELAAVGYVKANEPWPKRTEPCDE